MAELIKEINENGQQLGQHYATLASSMHNLNQLIERL